MKHSYTKRKYNCECKCTVQHNGENKSSESGKATEKFLEARKYSTAESTEVMKTILDYKASIYEFYIDLVFTLYNYKGKKKIPFHPSEVQ